ncbi:Mu transposase C-terminal domain-containing protein [Bacillus sp. FJAT-27445]|uniref:Mu transposase C-terminal domain-containing protein n=1 Tax=Bacillus sp. FJAT-27445 TaxID=1679166 RepID=UPI0007442B90|nr:Mu transposase C-terminal domain-containing protein [Bacillus sp. FJAT-27445]
MAGHYFRTGTRFLINDNEYVVRREIEDIDCEIENLSYKKIEVRRKHDLLSLWREGQLIFRVNEEIENLIKIQNINDVDEKLKNEAFERFNILAPVLNGDISPSEIPLYLTSLGDRVKRSAFYDWKSRWDKTEDIRSLVPIKPGPKGSRMESDLLEILDASIKFYLDSDGKHTIEDIYSEFILRINEENLIKGTDEKKLPYVSRSTVRRRKMKLINIFEQDKEKYGNILAKLKRDGVKKEVIAKRPLQRVEIDWTTVNVMLIDPVDLKAKRPTLIYAVDKATGYPLGFYITFNPVDSDALKQCLIHIIMPKTYLKELYPLVENDWISYGIPHTIVVDNHTVNDSYEFEEACYQVGVKDVQFCTIDAGYQKGTIERAFRALNTKFIHNLKGTTLSNFIEKGRYDSMKKACITMQGFIYMAHIAMVDMVANECSSRRGDSPHRLWISGMEANKHLSLQIPRSVDELKIMLMAGSELRKVQQQGIVVHNEWYYSKELMDIKNKLEQFNRQDEVVRVRFDWSDMRIVYVLDPFKKIYIQAKGTGFQRKNINTDYPVPIQVLQLESKVRTETKKSFDPSNRAKAKRKIAAIQENDNKTIKTWKDSSELDKVISSSFITDTVLNSETAVDVTSISDEITIVDSGTNDQSKRTKGKSKSNKPRDNENKKETIYMEFEDTDVDELPKWTTSLKREKRA